jgi:hypothetical protein
LLERSSDIAVVKRRMATTVAAAIAFLSLFVFAGLYLRSINLLLVVGVAYIIMNTLERVSYGYTIILYKGVIQKLLGKVPP